MVMLHKPHVLSIDLGATKCAAALVSCQVDNHHYEVLKSHRVQIAEYASLDALIDALEQGLGIRCSEVDAICIGAAGQYDGKVIRHTNGYPFEMPFFDVAKKREWPIFTVVHDYVPISCATFTSYLCDDNIKWLNKSEREVFGRGVTLGIGTGLGLKDAVLLPNGDFWLGCNEAGHIGVTRPPLIGAEHLERHKDFLHYLREEALVPEHQPLTFESILSGEGTARMHQFVYRKQRMTPEEVGEEMRSGEADETVAIFAWYLGMFIGSVQLIFMPSAGIWITGGVMLKHLEVFDHEEFQMGINAMPAYQSIRDKFPMGVLINTDHAFIGAAYYAVQRLLKSGSNIATPTFTGDTLSSLNQA